MAAYRSESSFTFDDLSQADAPRSARELPRLVAGRCGSSGRPGAARRRAVTAALGLVAAVRREREELLAELFAGFAQAGVPDVACAVELEVLGPTPGGLGIASLDHLVLTVADLDRTVAFYERLGMRLERIGDGRLRCASASRSSTSTRPATSSSPGRGARRRARPTCAS